MSITLKVNNVETDIPVRDMKDGDIGVITSWVIYRKDYIGLIIQYIFKYNMLIVLGKPTQEAWDRKDDLDMYDNCRVRLLKKGDVINVS